jgi:hypothetical protein
MKRSNSQVVAATSLLYGSDMKVRMPLSAASAIAGGVIRLAADMDVMEDARKHLGQSVVAAGTGEWMGSIDDRVLTIGWDWIQADSGGPTPWIGGLPRSNVQFVDEKGYDLPSAINDAKVFELIEALTRSASILMDSPG